MQSPLWRPVLHLRKTNIRPWTIKVDQRRTLTNFSNTSVLAVLIHHNDRAFKMPSKNKTIYAGSFAGTLVYLAPEVWELCLNMKTDVWSAG